MANKHGTLIIRSEPSEAMVTIEDISKMTPAIFDLRGRSIPYNVRIEKVGYYDYINKVVVLRGSKIEISASLEKIGE